jgi:hypothetical protein
MQRELVEIERKLNDGSDLLDVRQSIAKLMLDQLHALLAAPSYWENAHFANAVAALGMNIHALKQPTCSWLRLCFIDLCKAIESIQPDVATIAHDRHHDAVTIEELITTIEALDAKAENLAMACPLPAGIGLTSK